MALPVLLQKLFKSSGYGPELNDDIVSRHISVQDWSNAYDYPVSTLVRGSNGLLYWSVTQSGPNVGGAQDPTTDDGTYWQAMPLDDADVVHKTSNEDIRGIKNFYDTIIRRNENFISGVTPTEDQVWDISFKGTSSNSYMIINYFVTTADDVGCTFFIRNNSELEGFFVGLRFERTHDDKRSFHPTNTGVDLGANASNTRWAQIYAASTTISTSDARFKTEPEPVPDEVLDAWGDCGFVQFQMLDAVEKKGADAARIHNGMIAQRIDEAFKARGLDASRYGLFCYDEWAASPEERDEEGHVTLAAMDAGNQYSLRYEEALCMEAAYQRRRAGRAEARIAALEERLAALEAKIG